MAEQNKQLASRPKWDEREDFVDLSRLVATLIENKWLVIFVGLIVFSLGVIYAVTAPPIYKSDAMIQVEKSRSSILVWKSFLLLSRAGQVIPKLR